MSEQSWEQQAVTEILNAEQAIEALEKQIDHEEGLYALACELGLNTVRLEQKIEEMYSHLDDLKKVVGYGAS